MAIDPDVQVELDELETQITAVAAQVLAHTAQLAADAVNIGTNTEDIAVNTGQLITDGEAIADHTIQLATQDTLISGNTTLISGNTGLIEATETLLTATRGDLTALTTVVEQLTGTVNEFGIRVSTVEDSQTAVTDQLVALVARVDQLAASIDTLNVRADGTDQNLETLTNRVTDLEDNGGSPDLPYELFGPGVTAVKLNETIRDMAENYNGGEIQIDAKKKALKWDRPIIMQPGVIVRGTGMPTMFGDSRTRVNPQFSGPVFIVDDGTMYNDKKAWGGSGIYNIQISPRRSGVTMLQLQGGNGSEFRNLMSSKGSHALEAGVLIDEGRTDSGDGQYSTFDRVRMSRAHLGLGIYRGAPDCDFRHCMFYGTANENSRGMQIQKGAGGDQRPANYEFWNCHFQFQGKGLDIDTIEVEINGGSWENRTGASKYAPYAIRLGPNARDVTVRSLSMANLESLHTCFVLDPAATEYTFEYLSGHVSKDEVPAGYENHFVWH